MHFQSIAPPMSCVSFLALPPITPASFCFVEAIQAMPQSISMASPLLSGFRSTAFFLLAISRSLESRTGIGPNLVDSLALVTGPLPSELGNGQEFTGPPRRIRVGVEVGF